MSDVETPPPPAANGGAATDADVDITSPEFSDDSTVIPKLMSKIQVLEQDLVNEKVKIKQLEDEISSHESDKRALTSIAARASDLETEVSRLQHDLISSLSDGQEANAEASNLKAKVAEFESKERENVEKMKIIETERNLLLEKLKESEEKISELEAKERENEEKISVLVEKLEESEEKERVKTERVDALMEKLKESETIISELESEGRNKNVKVNEMLEKLDLLQKEIVSKEVVVESTSSSGGTNWPVIAVSAGAVVTLSLVYFRHAKF